MIGGFYEGKPDHLHFNYVYTFETNSWQDFEKFYHDIRICTPGLTVIRHEQMIYAVFYMGGRPSTYLWANSGDEADSDWKVEYILQESHGSEYMSIAMIPYIP